MDIIMDNAACRFIEAPYESFSIPFSDGQESQNP